MAEDSAEEDRGETGSGTLPPLEPGPTPDGKRSTGDFLPILNRWGFKDQLYRPVELDGGDEIRFFAVVPFHVAFDPVQRLPGLQGVKDRISDSAGPAVHLFAAPLFETRVDALEPLAAQETVNFALGPADQVGHLLIRCQDAARVGDHEDGDVEPVEVLTQGLPFPLFLEMFVAFLAETVGQASLSPCGVFVDLLSAVGADNLHDLSFPQQVQRADYL